MCCRTNLSESEAGEVSELLRSEADCEAEA